MGLNALGLLLIPRSVSPLQLAHYTTAVETLVLFSRLLLARSLARYGGCDGGRSGRRGRRRLPDNLLSPLPQ